MTVPKGVVIAAFLLAIVIAVTLGVQQRRIAQLESQKQELEWKAEVAEQLGCVMRDDHTVGCVDRTRTADGDWMRR